MADEDKINTDTDDLDDDVDDVDDTDGADDKSDGWKAPKTKAEYEAMVREQGNAEAKKWRLRAQGRDPNWKPEQGGTGEHGTNLKKDASADEIRAAVRREVEAEYNQKASGESLRASVAVALLSAGLALSDDETKSPAAARKAVNRVVNMIELKNLHLEDDGEISGLDDELSDLRKALPGLFRSGGTKRPATRGGDAGPKRETRRPKGDDDDEVLHDMAKSFFGQSSDD
jgi:hypothetical protein